MPLFRRLACRLWQFANRPPPARSAELWCRPATVLVLRDPSRARAPVADWR